MSILNVNQLQPVGGGNTITVGSSNIDYSGSITGNISVDGNLTVTGVVSNEDVTNIDSVGVITARSDISIVDKIVHTGDTNTAIRFPAADTFTVETGGSERFRIDSTGNTLIYGVLRKDNVNSSLSISGGNGADSSANIVLHGSSGSPANVTQFRTGSTERMRITSSGTVKIGSNTLITPSTDADNFVIDTGDVDSGISILSATTGRIYFGDAASNDQGSIRYVHTDDSMRFETNSGERLRITSVGDVLLGGLTSKNDGRNAKGITLKSPAGISFQNYGSNGSRNWRIRPDDLSSWGSLEFSVSPTDNDNTDWPDAAGDVVLELKKDKDVVVKNGNLVIGTSGQGIDFSANSHASQMSSEILDDYEEGTWTPDTGGVSWTTQAGTYTKVGNVVNLNFWLQASGTSSSTGGFSITGLPFANTNSANVRPTGAVRFYSPQNFSGNSGVVAWMSSGSSNIELAVIDNNGVTTATPLNHNIWRNGAEVHCTMTYQTS
jgi:hypothetical protein